MFRVWNDEIVEGGMADNFNPNFPASPLFYLLITACYYWFFNSSAAVFLFISLNPALLIPFAPWYWSIAKSKASWYIYAKCFFAIGSPLSSSIFIFYIFAVFLISSSSILFSKSYIYRSWIYYLKQIIFIRESGWLLFLKFTGSSSFIFRLH